MTPDNHQPENSSRATTVAPLSSRYEMLEQIGEGGMGKVFKARQIATDRLVAIKLLSDQYSDDETRRARFKQEAKAASTLYHPNLVSVVDFGCEADEQAFLVLDYIPGVGLDEILREKKRLDPHELIEIFSQICKGLSHVHAKGIVHRDMKPSNVMVVKEESGDVTVRIVDFGIAKHDRTQAITTTGELLGSPLYMSPEQALGQKVDARADIYSVGCMLYEAATGVPPFRGETAISTVMMRLNFEPTPFSQVAPFACLSEEFEKIVMRALRRDPSERYQTIAALQADLRDLERAHPRPNATAAATHAGLKTLRAQNADVAPPPAELNDGSPMKHSMVLTIVLMLIVIGCGFAVVNQHTHSAPAAPVVAQAPVTPPPVVAKPAAPVKPVVKPPVKKAAEPKVDKAKQPAKIPDYIKELQDEQNSEQQQEAALLAQKNAQLAAQQQLIRQLEQERQSRMSAASMPSHNPNPLVERTPSSPRQSTTPGLSSAQEEVMIRLRQELNGYNDRQHSPRERIQFFKQMLATVNQYGLNDTRVAADAHCHLGYAYKDNEEFDAGWQEKQLGESIRERCNMARRPY